MDYPTPDFDAQWATTLGGVTYHPDLAAPFCALAIEANDDYGLATLALRATSPAGSSTINPQPDKRGSAASSGNSRNRAEKRGRLLRIERA